MDNKKVIRKTIRFDAWKLYKEGKSIGEIADMLDAKFCHIHKLVTRWKGTERMEKIKERQETYYAPEEEDKKTLLEKISERESFANSFVLLTNNYKVQEAYHKMLHNHNSDLPL